MKTQSRKTEKRKGLNLRQEKFVGYYMKSGNASKAALEAGYSPRRSCKQGSDLLRHPAVNREISRRRALLSEKLSLDAEYVLMGLQSIYERCMQAEPVLDKEGMETGEYKFNPTNARRALRDIGEHLGMFGKQSEEEETTASRLVIVAESSLDNSSK